MKSLPLFSIFYFLFAIPAPATTVFGNLSDISIAALNTKIMFAPTNEVLLVQSGLSAGPPKIITTVNGAFSLSLEPGDYTVSLPLITWRHPFSISVFATNVSMNITNFLNTPRTYLYTNRFIPPLHVNTARVTVLSTAGQTTLLTSPATITANTLGPGNIVTIEAYGSYTDPGGNAPSADFTVKLGSTVIVTQGQNIGGGHWHLRALVTIRTSGTTAAVVGTIRITDDASTIFPCDSQTATVNTTTSLSLDLRASIQDFTGAEAVHCDQLTIHLE